jgi:hypothetical protein
LNINDRTVNIYDGFMKIPIAFSASEEAAFASKTENTGTALRAVFGPTKKPRH